MKTPHIRLRGRSFYWRRRVPPELHAVMGRSEFVVALGTRSFDEAALRARRLTVVADRVFAMLLARNELTRAGAVQIAREWFLTELSEMEGVSAAEGPRSHARLQKISKLVPLMTAYRESALIRNSTDLMDSVAAQCLEDRGLNCSHGSPEFGYLKFLLLRAHAEVLRHYERWLEGDFTVSPSDQFLNGVQAYQQPSLDQDKAKWGESPRPPAHTGPLFSVLAAKFVDEMEGSQQWRGQTAKQNRVTYRLFVEALGDRPLQSYSRADLATFHDKIKGLPRTYGKSAKDKDKPLEQLLAHSSRDEIATLSGVTLARHMRALSTLFNWGAKRGVYEGSNPATGFGERRRGRARDQRDAWTPSQLHTLFQSPIYTGCLSEARCGAPGPLALRNSPKFWVPLIGAFSGMRVEEICQLYAGDIKCEDGIWYFDVRDEGEQRTKTEAGERRVPLHRQLIEAGLLAYVMEMRRNQHKMLFPTLISGGADKKFSHAFVKWFSRYRSKLNGCENVCFHSLRHTVETALLRADVSPHVVDELIGHEHEGMRSRYFKGCTLLQLKNGIDRVTFPTLDLSHLNRT